MSGEAEDACTKWTLSACELVVARIATALTRPIDSRCAGLGLCGDGTAVGVRRNRPLQGGARRMGVRLRR